MAAVISEPIVVTQISTAAVSCPEGQETFDTGQTGNQAACSVSKLGCFWTTIEPLVSQKRTAFLMRFQKQTQIVFKPSTRLKKPDKYSFKAK